NDSNCNLWTCKIDQKLLGSQFNILDALGKAVLSGALNSEITTLEIGNLSGGVYLLNIGENLKQTFKVIKE
ncbi:MAG: T9SS type A sorting domain-containing protein, partial [Bacteroidetes bacterium]|nr:T9SS type A sorting domain-containing protein [Bacteroidota bacterium]